MYSNKKLTVKLTMTIENGQFYQSKSMFEIFPVLHYTEIGGVLGG